MEKVFLWPNQLTTKTAGDRIKTATKEMKKTLMTMAMLVIMAAGAMMLSAFATPKQDAKAKSSQIQLNDDDWKLVGEDVAYCSDKGQCLGRGKVYINRNNGQLRFRYNATNFDLTEYTGVDGYNYRFWNDQLNPSQYCYVYINTRYITF